MERRTGHSFRNPRLLEEALTHPSMAARRNNQRLEFLGDSVLGAAVAKLLFGLYPQESEGELARRHAALVRSETLASVARDIELGQALSMAASETAAGGRDNPANLEDACEALIGALFLDGGYQAAETFILAHWEPRARATLTPPKDAKTALQEWAQARGLPVPSYTLRATAGPAHAPLFTIAAQVENHGEAEASAASKKAAEQAAAELLLASLAKP